MDLKDIKTVSDLVKANESEDDVSEKEILVETITKEIYDQDPEIGMAVSIHVLKSLLSWHHDIMTENIKDGNAEMAAVWALDVSRLDEAINIIKRIEM